MKYILLIVYVLFSSLLFGQGIEPTGDPRQVSTLEHLQWISENPTCWGDDFSQTASIDASATSGWNNGNGFSPIGNSTTPFSGVYEGNGHVIDGLFIDLAGSNEVGFFGYAENAIITELGITNVNITASRKAGALIGKSNNSNLSKCYSTGAVFSNWAAGGLIGRSETDTLDFCFSRVNVTGTGNGDYTGGLIGIAEVNTSISNCYCRGNVSGDNYVGGLVGVCVGAAIEFCYSTGAVSANSVAGGFAGFIDATTSIDSCFWDMDNSGQSISAGGIGLTTQEAKYLYGYHAYGWDFARESFNGTVNCWDMDFSGIKNDGYPYLFWEDGNSVSLQPPSGTGQDINPYQISNLFELFWISANPGKWNKIYIQTADINAGDTQYWNKGHGFNPIGNTENNFTGTYNGGNYVIDSLFIDRPNSDYQALLGKVQSTGVKNISLTNANITGKDYTGGIIGSIIFGTRIENLTCTGSIFGEELTGGIIGFAYPRGDDRSISNCSSSCDVVSVNSNYIGSLIGNNYRYRVLNCHSSGSVIADDSFSCGGLIGSNSGTIESCSSSAFVSGLNLTNIGGLVGYNSGDVVNSFSTGDVYCATAQNVGGLVGSVVYGSVVNCFSSSNVTAQNDAGGLIGFLHSSTEIANCYSSGAVSSTSNAGGLVGSGAGTVTGCFWDTQTSGQSVSAGGTGRNTNNMQSMYTYLNAGWDFIGETDNGTDDVWVLRNGHYPECAAEFTPPVISSISDIPGDQGHQVEILWSRASMDTQYFNTRFYSIWRLTETSPTRNLNDTVLNSLENFSTILTSFTDSNSGNSRTVNEQNTVNSNLFLHTRNSYWTYLDTIPSMMLSNYAVIAPTMIDSIQSLSVDEYETTFMVVYHFENGFYQSDPLSGYSLDNIPPLAVDNVQVDLSQTRTTGLVLQWNEVTDGLYNGNLYPELNGVYYKIYASPSPDFVCDQSTYLTTTQDLSYTIDTIGSNKKFFRVVVSDQP